MAAEVNGSGIAASRILSTQWLHTRGDQTGVRREPQGSGMTARRVSRAGATELGFPVTGTLSDVEKTGPPQPQCLSPLK